MKKTKEKNIVYYIEYEKTIKYFYNNNIIELIKDESIIKSFVLFALKKYNKNIDFKSLI